MTLEKENAGSPAMEMDRERWQVLVCELLAENQQLRGRVERLEDRVEEAEKDKRAAVPWGGMLL